MNKIFFTKRTSILLLAISLFSSCMEKDVYQGDKNTPLNPTEVFDFSLTKEVKLNVDMVSPTTITLFSSSTIRIP